MRRMFQESAGWQETKLPKKVGQACRLSEAPRLVVPSLEKLIQVSVLNISVLKTTEVEFKLIFF